MDFMLLFQVNSFCMFVCSAFESELADVIPVVKTSIAGTRIIGRLCAGTDISLLKHAPPSQPFFYFCLFETH